MNPLIITAAIGVAVAVAVLLLMAGVALRRVVPTNRVDIVQSAKWTRSYGKGRDYGNAYYAIPSFVPVFGVTITHFPESVFDITLSGYDAYDSGRLPFLVDVMAFFRVEDSDTAAHRVAHFDELRDQLKGVLQGAVRRTLAVHKLEQIMEDRTALGQTFTEEVNEQLKEWGVTTAKSIEFMDIRDVQGSQVISNIMAKEKSRIEMESRMAVAGNMQNAQTREVEASREVQMRQQEAALAVGQKAAATKQAVGVAEQQATQEVLTQEQETAKRQMEVQQVQDVRAAEIAQSVAVVQAEQARKVAVVESDAERQRQEIVAQGRLAAAKLDAQGTQAKGEAEGNAKRAVLLAEVAPQITLAKEIGSNEGYQSYLVRIRGVEAQQAVGVANAEALKAADIKVIATGGSVQSSLGSVSELFTPKGGATIGGMIEGLEAVAPAAVEAVRAATRKPNGSARQPA